MAIKDHLPQQFEVGIIGFGEVGQVIAAGLKANGQNVMIYDTRLLDDRDPLIETAERLKVETAKTLLQLAENCSLVFLLVPSNASTAVSNEFSASLQPGTFFLDLTTSLPSVKKENALSIHKSGGKYTDVSIMGTVATEQYNVPLLLAGEHAGEVQKIFGAFGLNSKVISDAVGAAASIKMLRSIFMKGIEALLFETMLTAEKYQVRDEVMDSISTTMKNNDFEKLADTLIITHIKHRGRRQKEVKESISLVKEAGIYPFVTEGVLSFFSNSIAAAKADSAIRENVRDILQHELEKI
ncbi:NAD(P)-binding domain-containing protein [Planococcus sp. FY231025]|uniref:NAD(P)-binding domain-containing protein n=1 Tax=Planococcus sp. FY231025 TaxID=3455699 RepID=UPI003F930318